MPSTPLDFELVAFDVAGTTLRVADEVPTAFRHAFATVDLDVADVQVRSVRGVSKRHAIEELVAELAPDRHEGERTTMSAAVFASFKGCLLDIYGTADVHPIAGVEETFEWLRGRGTSIALTTGFDRDLIGLLLARVGWTDTLDAVVCDDDVKQGRPAPDLILEAMLRTKTDDPLRVVAVGDTTADLFAAQRAGVGYAVGVLSGAHTETMLLQAPHDALVGSVADLPAALLSAVPRVSRDPE